MTPSYPIFKQSYLEGIYSADFILFNRRDDVNFYEISVFDDSWTPMPFASTSSIIKVDYLQTVFFTVHIRKKDIDAVTYICTSSKLRKASREISAVSSRICSKIKREQVD